MGIPVQFDSEVNVAVGSGFAARDRAEQRQMADAGRAQLRHMRPQRIDDPIGRDCRVQVAHKPYIVARYRCYGFPPYSPPAGLFLKYPSPRASRSRAGSRRAATPKPPEPGASMMTRPPAGTRN